MPEMSERTRLLENPGIPQYAFDTRSWRERKERVKRFQWCLCVLLIGLLIFIIVITISMGINYYNLNEDQVTVTQTWKPSNNSARTSTSSTKSVPLNLKLLVLSNNEQCPVIGSQYRDEDRRELENALQMGRKALAERDTFEKDVPLLEVDTPSYRHQKVTATSSRATEMARKGFVQEVAAMHLKKSKNITTINLCDASDKSRSCDDVPIKCDLEAKYSNYNGTCNNLDHPSTYGAAYTPFKRLLPPDYSDGLSKPRMAKSGRPLPSARTVSRVIHRPVYATDDKFTVMLAVWGQFLDHDITATALSHTSNGGSIKCCEAEKVHPECFPVIIDEDDPLRDEGIECMEFVRSASAPQCRLGPREQLNQATSFIDGSVIYGNDEETVKKLRTMEKGLLKMYMTEDGRELLPISEDPLDGCNREEEKRKGRYCFMTGDARANENQHLTSLHLIMARQHNRVAKKLAQINPHWDDETIFLETRRIIGAQMQHISYNEFLPCLFGSKMMHELGFVPSRQGFFDGYNSTIDPSIFNSFAASAFRFAHSIIPALMKRLSDDTSSVQYIKMREMLFNPFALFNKGELDRTIRGAIATNIDANDAYFTTELKDHLFEGPLPGPKKIGLDLVTLNIQRGRDHGLPGYVKFRQYCGLSDVGNFDDLVGIINPDSLDHIRRLYEDVQDIDLYTGSISEVPLTEGILGPTMSCLIREQFLRTRHGDRFWFENPAQPHSFTLAQLNEIKKTTLARIICDNADDVASIRPWVMATADEQNGEFPCAVLPTVHLDRWKEPAGRLARVSLGESGIRAAVFRRN